MTERFIPPAPPAAPPVKKVARFIPQVEPEPDPASLPFAVGEYIDVNLVDHDHSAWRSGYRSYLVIHVYPRKREVRLFDPTNLSAFDYDMKTLERNKTMRKRTDQYHAKLAKRIRAHKSEYKAYGMGFTSDVDMALAALKAEDT